MKKLFIIIILFVFSRTSYAWLPCVPFCDSGCGGSALQMMGASVSSAMQSQMSTNQQLLQAINNTTQSTISLGADLSEAWTVATMDVLSGIEASTAKIELAQTGQIKQREFNTNSLNTALVQALKQKHIAEVAGENNQILSRQSMPETGEIGVLRATPLKEAYFNSRQLAEEITLNQKQYSNELSPGDASIALNTRLSAANTTLQSHNLLTKKTLTELELNQGQDLLTYLTNSKPLPILSENELSSPGAQTYELNRRIHNSTRELVSTVVNEVISHKAQFASPSFVRSYVNLSTAEPRLSLDETLSSLIDGRLSSEGWFLNIKLLNEVGLKREHLYLTAESNVLLFQLTQKREWRNQLMAIVAMGDLSKKTNILRDAL